MSRFHMGHGAGNGLHGTNIRRVYGWLWQSWLEALKEVPTLRWLSLTAVVCALAVMGLAISEGKGLLEIGAYAMTAFLFVLVVPAIHYTLFEIYRRHRSDAIFSSRRLEDIIRQLVQEGIAAHEASVQGKGL